MSSTHQKKTMLSAIQPSHQLTLGNYLGALKNWVRLQNDFDCIFFAVDLHAITAVRHKPEDLRRQTIEAIAYYLAAGIHPDQTLLFIQSHVPEHSELMWLLNCFTYMGELGRMTQYKDKSTKQGANIPAGLFNYPVLMASDILLYQTHLVPVGEDQKQHLELTRDIAVRMNQLFGGDLFTLPEAYIPKVGARIMSLQDPTSKMSKSDPDPHAALFLSDSDDTILKKLKRAVTDSGSEVTYENEKPGIRNLINIQAAILGKSPEEIVGSYVGKKYGHLKMETAEVVIQELRPVREKVQHLLTQPEFIMSILKKGAESARLRAKKTLSKAYERIGFIQ